MSFDESFGYSPSFNLNQYAPVDPLASCIPGLDLLNNGPSVEEGSSAIPSTSSTSSRNVAPTPKTEPANMAPKFTNPYESWQPNTKRYREKSEKEKRRLETEELRRQVKDAPAYVPTPIKREPQTPSPPPLPPPPPAQAIPTKSIKVEPEFAYANLEFGDEEDDDAIIGIRKKRTAVDINEYDEENVPEKVNVKKEPMEVPTKNNQKNVEVIDLVSSDEEIEVRKAPKKTPFMKVEPESSDDEFINHVEQRKLKMKKKTNRSPSDSSDSGIPNDRKKSKRQSSTSSFSSSEEDESSQNSSELTESSDEDEDDIDDFIVANSDPEDDIWTKKRRKKRGCDSSGEEFEPEKINNKKKKKRSSEVRRRGRSSESHSTKKRSQKESMKEKEKMTSRKVRESDSKEEDEWRRRKRAESKRKIEKKDKEKSSRKDFVSREDRSNKEKKRKVSRILSDSDFDDLPPIKVITKKEPRGISASESISDESTQRKSKKSSSNAPVRKLSHWEEEQLKKKKLREAMNKREEKAEKRRNELFMGVKGAHVKHWEQEIHTRNNRCPHKKILIRSSPPEPEQEQEAPPPSPAPPKSTTIKRKHSDDDSDKPSTSKTKKVEKEPEPLDKYESLVPKRVAHSNSGGAEPRRPLNPPPMRKLPNREENLAKTHEKAMEQKRKQQQEAEQLKKKKYLTQEEMYGQKKSVVGSLGKGEARVARPLNHTASAVPKKIVSIKKEPMSPGKARKVAEPKAPPVLEPFNRKIKSSDRAAMIKSIFTKLLENNREDAAEEAQRIELEVMNETKPHNYKVKCIHAVTRIIKQAEDACIPISNKSVFSHAKMMGGRNYDKVKAGVKRASRKPYEQMTHDEIREYISLTMKASLEEMRDNGYPLFNSDTLEVTIKPTMYDEKKKVWMEEKDMMRTCCRCHQEFRVLPNGDVPEIECRFHNRGFDVEGKKDTYQKKHSCCQMERNAPGCRFAKTHVFDHLFASELQKFVHTPPETENDPRSNAIYAIDCEMVYTISGPALGRVSVVDMKGNLVLDVLVKPPTKVIDSNFEFSGLKMEDLESATDDLPSAINKLFDIVNAKTLLIGHSLESDFKAMRLIHYNVVDTSLLFKTGLRKPSLKSLTSTHILSFIQSDNDHSNGHNSSEDAKACIDLIIHRIKKRM